MDQEHALRCLDLLKGAIADLIRLPPGDDRLDPRDPNYRIKTTALAKAVSTSNDSVQRLASLMRIVYQVRCNLLQGSKDPEVMRDQDLVAYCTPILEVVIPTLQEIMECHHSLPSPTVAGR